MGTVATSAGPSPTAAYDRTLGRSAFGRTPAQPRCRWLRARATLGLAMRWCARRSSQRAGCRAGSPHCPVLVSSRRAMKFGVQRSLSSSRAAETWRSSETTLSRRQASSADADSTVSPSVLAASSARRWRTPCGLSATAAARLIGQVPGDLGDVASSGQGAVQNERTRPRSRPEADRRRCPRWFPAGRRHRRGSLVDELTARVTESCYYPRRRRPAAAAELRGSATSFVVPAGAGQHRQGDGQRVVEGGAAVRPPAARAAQRQSA
jgi:hypothetical protein